MNEKSIQISYNTNFKEYVYIFVYINKTLFYKAYFIRTLS